MRYVQVVTGQKSRTVYRFVPPKDAKLAGVVAAKEWTSKGQATVDSKRLNIKIDKFRRGEMKEPINTDSPISAVLTWWIEKEDPPQYKQTYARASRLTVGDMSLRDFCDNIEAVYSNWLEKESASSASQKLNALSTMLDFCVSKKLIVSNPAKTIKRVPPNLPLDVENNLWSEDIAHSIIDHCMQDVEKANLGVLMLLVGSTLQKVSSIINLTWDDVNLTTEFAEIAVGDKVFTLSASLTTLLDQQYERYGHQLFVVPKVKLGHSVTGPSEAFPNDLRNVQDDLGLGPGLNLGSYRDFCIKQRILDGDDLEELRWITGMSEERFNKLVDTTKAEVVHLS